MNTLTIKNLIFGYEAENKIFKGLSLSIEKGETIGLIGPNGAGKSTFLQLILGILKADSGEISLDGRPLDKKSNGYFRENIGLVFQNPDEQLFMPSVFDDVAFGPRNQGLDELSVTNVVNETLNHLGIAHLSSRSPAKLSGGEKRCVAIATVLAMKPNMIILDEPTLALDPKSRRRVVSLIKSMAVTKVITSHDMNLIKETCTRVIILNNGEILADGNPAQFVLIFVPL